LELGVIVAAPGVLVSGVDVEDGEVLGWLVEFVAPVDGALIVPVELLVFDEAEGAAVVPGFASCC